MQTTRALMTAEDLERLPRDGQRHALIAGVLRTMAPAGDDHGRYIIHLTAPLALHVLRNKLGAVYAAETGFRLARRPDTVQAADLAFVRRARVRPFGPKRPSYFEGAPDLAVEVVSPDDRYTEVAETVQTWLAHETAVVLVIDPRQRTVTIHRATAEPGHAEVRTLGEADTLTIPDLFGAWALPVATIFAEEPDLSAAIHDEATGGEGSPPGRGPLAGAG
jgi:Uma2 family endonuclease